VLRTLQTIKHLDLDRDAWIAGAIANGIPPEYGAVLRQLTETVASGHGSRPNDFAHNNVNAWKEVK
jgi:hypothetical protein